MSPGIAGARFEAGQNSGLRHPKDRRCRKWKNIFNRLILVMMTLHVETFRCTG